MGGGVQLGPGEGGGDIDGGVLPDHARLFVGSEAGFFEATQLETVELDQVTGVFGLEGPYPGAGTGGAGGIEFCFGESPRHG